MDPTCPSGCAEEVEVLPGFVFDECVPEINFGQISEIYLGIPGNPFTAITSLSEWTARLASVTATRIIKLIVTGDRPRSNAAAPLELSGNRKKAVPRDFTLNFTIDETSQVNHDAVRQLQCGGNFIYWYRTLENKYVYGGNTGIKGFIDADMVIPREKNGMIVYEGTITSTGTFMEERTLFPIA